MPKSDRSAGGRGALRHGTRTDACFALKLPQAWETAGWYPASYCLRYRQNRDELTASLEGFVFRRADRRPAPGARRLVTRALR